MLEFLDSFKETIPGLIVFGALGSALFHFGLKFLSWIAKLLGPVVPAIADVIITIEAIQNLALKTGSPHHTIIMLLIHLGFLAFYMFAFTVLVIMVGIEKIIQGPSFDPAVVCYIFGFAFIYSLLTEIHAMSKLIRGFIVKQEIKETKETD